MVLPISINPSAIDLLEHNPSTIQNSGPVPLTINGVRYQYDTLLSQEENKNNAIQFAINCIELGESSLGLGRSFATHERHPIVTNQEDITNIVRYLHGEINFTHLIHEQYYLYRHNGGYYYIYVPEDVSNISWNWTTEDAVIHSIGINQCNFQ
jgi:hypothetical protein